MDIGLVFATVAWICTLLAFVLVIPAVVVGTVSYIRENGFHVIRRRQHVYFTSMLTLDRETVARSALIAQNRWQKLWTGTWPPYLRQQAQHVSKPEVIDGSSTLFTVRSGIHLIYDINVRKIDEDYYCLQVKRRVLLLWYVAPTFAFLASAAIGNIITALLSAFVLFLSQCDLGGMGWYILDELYANVI